jgi:hypothetical protein
VSALAVGGADGRTLVVKPFVIDEDEGKVAAPDGSDIGGRVDWGIISRPSVMPVVIELTKIDSRVRRRWVV